MSAAPARRRSVGVAPSHLVVAAAAAANQDVKASSAPEPTADSWQLPSPWAHCPLSCRGFRAAGAPPGCVMTPSTSPCLACQQGEMLDAPSAANKNIVRLLAATGGQPAHMPAQASPTLLHPGTGAAASIH